MDISGRIAALEDERRGYEAHGKTDRAEQVDAELARLRGEGRKNSKPVGAKPKRAQTQR